MNPKKLFSVVKTIIEHEGLNTFSFVGGKLTVEKRAVDNSAIGVANASTTPVESPKVDIKEPPLAGKVSVRKKL